MINIGDSIENNANHKLFDEKLKIIEIPVEKYHSAYIAVILVHIA